MSHKKSSKAVANRLESLLLVFLTLVFTIGLVFASFELPKTVDRMLDRNVQFLDVASGQDGLTEYKTELFLSHYNIRPGK